MLLFWRHGYEGTSMSRLSQAMELNAPSIYSAFGSKEELYRECLRLYLGGLGDIGISRLNDSPTAREGVRCILLEAARAFTRSGYPPGCMVGVGSLRCAVENQIAEEETAALRKRSQLAFHERLTLARKDGELPKGTDIAALVDFYSSVVEGMSVQARDGASRARLVKIAELALKVWPDD